MQLSHSETTFSQSEAPSNGLALDISQVPMQTPVKVSTDSDASDCKSSEEVRIWIVGYLSNLLEIAADEIETDVPFDSYGLDSSAAIGLTGDLEDWIGREVDPTLLYDYPTVESLVNYLTAPV